MEQHTHVAASVPEAAKTLTWLSYVICLLGALFYLYEFVLQVSPGVMTNELMRDLGLNAATLGIVSACYYYAYTPMQVPAGLLYDRYGPRLLLTIAILVCAVGALFFGLATNAIFASVGRFFMGAGSAFSFIGALMLVSRWFPPQYFALLAGLIQLMSSIGAITGEAPLAAVIASVGWRQTILTVSVLGVVLGFIVWTIVRDNPEGDRKIETHTTHTKELKRLRGILSSKPHCLTAIYSFTTWAPITAFAALWGVPYLVASYHISTTQAALGCSMIWLGIGLGSPLVGWLSDFIKRRCLLLQLCSCLALITTLVILYVPHLPLPLMYTALFLFGVAASSQALSFGLIKDISHPGMIGTAIGFNNMAVVAGGAICQPLVGLLLRLGWNGEMSEGIPVYTVADYQLAMLVLPICSLAGIFICWRYLRETYCESVHDSVSY